MLWDIGQLRQRLTIRRDPRPEFFGFQATRSPRDQAIANMKRTKRFEVFLSYKNEKLCVCIHTNLCVRVRFA
jgi:hypothetical protein